MRDALSLLDCCLSYTDGTVTLQLARDVLGTAGRAFMFDFADALIDFDTARALLLIDDMMNKGCDPQVFARDVVAHLRALMLAGAVGDVADLLEITPEDAAHFSEQTKRVPSERLSRLMDLFMRAEPDMKWATRPRTVLELCCVRACHPEQEADASLSERLDRMEKILANGVTIAAAKPAAKKEAPAAEKPAEKAAPASKPAAPTATPPQEYLNALEAVANETPSIRATLPSMVFVGMTENVVTVQFSKKQMMHMKMLERKKAMIDGALSDAFGRPMSIHMVLEGERNAAASPTTATIAKRVIEQSYDIFGRENITLTDEN